MNAIENIELNNFLNHCENYIKRQEIGFKESFIPILIHNILYECVENKALFSVKQYGNIITYLTKLEQ